MDRASTHEAFAAELVALREREGLEQLVHRARQVEETMSTPGWAFIAELLDQRIKEVLGVVMPMSAKSPVLSGEAVHRALGLAAGLQQALELPTTIRVKAEESVAARASADAGGEETA